MEKEFVPYEQALALKELGFNEPCLGGYISFVGSETFELAFYKYRNVDFNKTLNIYISAPTYSQAFRWFREKYNLCGEVYTVNMGAIDYTFLIRDLYSEDVKYDNFEANTGGYSGTFNTYEETELACLIKLIEIVKEKK